MGHGVKHIVILVCLALNGTEYAALEKDVNDEMADRIAASELVLPKNLENQRRIPLPGAFYFPNHCSAEHQNWRGKNQEEFNGQRGMLHTGGQRHRVG